MLALVFERLLTPWSVGWCLGTTLLLISLTRWIKNRNLNLPPGPKGLPLVGFMPFFDKKTPYIQVHELRKTYGDVFGMYIGNQYNLILNDVGALKEAFNKEDFNYRPSELFQMPDGCQNFIGSNGQHWFDHRRLASKCIRQFVQNTEETESAILNIFRTYLDRMEKESVQNGKREVNVDGILADAINSVSYLLLCGRTLTPGHEALGIISRFQSAFAENGTNFSVERTLPWLKPVMYTLVPSRKKIYKAFHDIERYCWSEIESHEKVPEEDPKDFLGVYIQERSKGPSKEKFTRHHLNGDTQVLLFASGDTLRFTLIWYILLMAKHPEVQERAYKEIQEFLGPSGVLRYADKKNMPYTEATLLESMRHITLVPFTPPHRTSNEKVTKFRGYDIPPNSIVVANMYSIQKDPKNWKYPDLYYPEHFLTEDGKTVKIPDSFVAFSSGKRFCVGDKLALMESFLFAVSLLQRFQILPPEGGVCMEESLTGIREAHHPIVRISPRNE